ncbi:unnamed protein product [Caenorhabditis brenneri]
MESQETNGDLSWLDLFVDPSAVQTSILDPERKKQLPRLCMQFTDKGFLAEREKDKGKLAQEELMLFERKSASMRLCAMATFAALDYDIEYIIDNIPRNELQTLRVLADNFYRIYNERNLDATFGNWLFYRFVLSIDRRNRLAPPAPRATIATTLSNGQLMPTDPALLKHEKTQRTVMELREHVGKARAFITELSEAQRDVVAPGIQCFIKPFVELAPKAMTAALLGDRNVLIENPAPDFEVEKVILPACDVANKCLSELVTFLFTSGELLEAKNILHRLKLPRTQHPLVAIDTEIFKSYCQMLDVRTGPFAATTTIRPFVFDLNTLNDENMRKSEVYRHRGVLETSGQLKDVYEAENAAYSVIDGHPECIRERLKTPAQVERFVKVLKRKLAEMRAKHRLQLIRAHLQYLCASIPNLREVLESNGVDVTGLRKFAVPSHQLKLEKAPTFEQLTNLIRGTDPYWTIMTEYDLSTLKQALLELGPFWFSLKMPVSDFLHDTLEKNVNTASYNLQRLLLSKLNQLARMRNFESFVKRLVAYAPEFGPEMGMEFTLESIYVKAAIGNEQMAWDRVHTELSTAQTSLIFNAEHIRPVESSSTMINQCLAQMLNLGDHAIVFEKGGQIPMEIFKCVPIARIFGAFLQGYDNIVTQKKCADGFWRTVTPKFNECQPSRLRRSADLDQKMKEARKELSLLFHMFSVLREPRLLDFIVAYAVCLHNKLMNIQKKPYLKMHARLLNMYTPDSNSPKLEINSLDEVRQLVQSIVEKAYSISPTDPDTCRTYADFLFVEKDYQGAAQKYLEYFASSEPSLRIPTSSDIFDDLMIQRLRICTANAGYLTMSLLCCQWLQINRMKEYQKAMELLRCNETRDVGANCAEFVIDGNAVELLSQLYYDNRMTKSLNTLYTGASSLSANQNVPGPLMKQEVERRTSKLLSSLASIYFGFHL